jgi:hypothetical protein
MTRDELLKIKASTPKGTGYARSASDAHTTDTITHMIAHTIDSMYTNLDRLVGNMSMKEAIKFVRELQELRAIELSLQNNPNDKTNGL